MPKKQTGVAVRVLISMPRANQLEDTIFIDPRNLVFTTPPNADQVADAARAQVLDDLEIDAHADISLRLPKGRETIDVKIVNEILEQIATAAKPQIENNLKVKVLNAREALAEVKAFQKANESDS